MQVVVVGVILVVGVVVVVMVSVDVGVVVVVVVVVDVFIVIVCLGIFVCVLVCHHSFLYLALWSKGRVDGSNSGRPRFDPHILNGCSRISS